VAQLRESLFCAEWGLALALPDIPENERTPLVLLLLDLIHQQQEQIARLQDEVATLKGLQPRPTIRHGAGALSRFASIWSRFI
jgi:hypothetical protein